MGTGGVATVRQPNEKIKLLPRKRIIRVSCKTTVVLIHFFIVYLVGLPTNNIFGITTSELSTKSK